MALSVGKRQWFRLWNGVALQQVEEVLLSPMEVERVRNVAIYEKLLGGERRSCQENGFEFTRSLLSYQARCVVHPMRWQRCACFRAVGLELNRLRVVSHPHGTAALRAEIDSDRWYAKCRELLKREISDAIVTMQR